MLLSHLLEEEEEEEEKEEGTHFLPVRNSGAPQLRLLMNLSFQ